ncbi:hypothetical protein E4T56_gene16490 [Termitomyces sp. T112]|nr:hypothetical protein E4T56_gene16490 [Termitomyces sp. T112]
MSPPSYSAASPTPLISDADVVIMYNSEGEEFEHRRQAELSAVVVGSPGGPRRAKFHPAVPQLVAGDAEGVPPLQQIPQAGVTAEEFARALVWAQGSLTLEWCQNEAPCVLCARQGEACIFDAPSVGLRRDTSICLPCHANHEKCSILLEWRAACVAVEQGWDEDWVWSQLGEVQRTRTSGEASSGQVGPPQGGRREGASSAADHGKWRASPPSGVGPSKRPRGHSLGTGIKFSGAPAFDHGGLPLQAGGGANSGVGSMGGGALMGEGGSRCGAGREGDVGAGVEHLSAGGAGASVRGMGLAGASNAAGGAAHRGGGGAGNGTGGWSATSGVGGSKVEGGLAGQ